MGNSEQQKIQEIIGAIRVLEEAIERFTTKAAPPIFIQEKGKERFRYSTKSSAVLQVLKAIRVVSCLNALLILLRYGFVQEMGVLLRTIDDFLGEITFLHEAHQTGKPTVDQQRFVKLFFGEDTRSLEEMLRGQQQPEWVARRKIHAAEARWLSPNNPEYIRRRLKAVADVFNQFAHGSYPAIMELYEGGTEKFRVRGMLGTPRIPVFRRQIALQVHRSLNVFALVAMALDLGDVYEHLLETRRAFEKSGGYRA